MTVRRQARGTLLLGVFVSVFGLCSRPSMSAEQSAKQTPQIRPEESPRDKELRASLQATADRLFAILKDGNPHDLLSLFSLSGVAFEIDGPAVPPAILKLTFEKRKAYYCLVFNTDCLRKEDRQMRKKAGAPAPSAGLLSLRDRILQNPSRQFKVFLSTQDKVPGGQISMESFDFGLDLENGKWKIVNVHSE